jgi:hypothetical protein
MKKTAALLRELDTLIDGDRYFLSHASRPSAIAVTASAARRRNRFF